MKNWKKPFSVLSATALLSGVLFTTSVDASSALKKVDAHYKNIKIINNSQEVTIDPKTEPFLLNGVTYIPLRMMGELYNKNVQWNGESNTITIKDITTPISQATVDSLTAQIKSKDLQIAQLQAEINKLKESQKAGNLDALEKQLNDDYYDYYNDLDDVDIMLSGDKNKIDIRIDVDGKDWNSLTSSEKTKFLQAIINDILKEFKDADIKGTIKDADNSSKQLASFNIDSSDKVRLTATNTDLDDLEDELNDDYYDYDGIDDIDIILDGDEDDIDLTIEVNADDWNDLSKKNKLKFLQDIVDDILYEFKKAEIDGTVKNADNGKKLDTFYADGSDGGDVEID
ncbi:copper amine oxidase family protein [Schinkia azotoformans MEV2011]|uniref:Copper amine oxidase family protein n=1 Tax=Schinkia azotoformans MEV2011 TaxID=1348973 RepID=A0A072NI55_SCHAZ|nr:stalk domain-containing protein [Schinkia azotoformans]KEF37161.1 copper amine oxidase family protein [Schinkia azotoformans MEV2011]MEC1695438.1 stalk domain-containing protein [Schinkia azotoformans]MEC1725718.1 stalk domain-containing protein [Schinkia azotoformans]MEC1771983.1 stalk domain-containing protein [Schinkia azotoformans]MED4366481.1 stalk domain-containing protein [Schinkia azotoformans]